MPDLGAGVLAGKVALVTGGSRGLGRSMALGFADAGADVIVASRKIENCRAVAQEVEAKGRSALAVACHVGHWDELEGLVEQSYEAFGHVDVLVNNAGMSLLYDSLPSVSETMWDKVVDLNLKGPFRLTALVGSRMESDPRGGSIINISSTGSIRPAPGMLPYDAAKAGLNALTGIRPRLRSDGARELHNGRPVHDRRDRSLGHPRLRTGRQGQFRPPARRPTRRDRRCGALLRQ
jgi:NAD(P)-dependent dehydrogenase (short-subunit alcohol dehydrogenase family)